MRESLFVFSGAVALAVASSVAGAADLPRRTAPVAPAFAPALAPAFSWTGFYVGLNAGVGFLDNSNDRINLPAGSIVGSGGTNGTLSFNDNNNDSGFVGGGQIGYNWQIWPGSGLVIGIEADFQYADLGDDGGRTGNYTFNPRGLGLGLAFAPPSATIVRNGDGVESFGTVRGRLGWAWDRMLLYGTGGFAYGIDNDSEIGWTAGGGVEYAWGNNITLRLEGLYVDLDQKNGGGRPVYNLASNTLVLNGADNPNNGFSVIRVGVNYKF